jgi:hypothetical protein
LRPTQQCRHESTPGGHREALASRAVTSATVLLLGAGASAEAGIRTTAYLTYDVVKGALDREKARLAEAEARDKALRDRARAGDSAAQAEWQALIQYKNHPITPVIRADPLEVVFGRLRAQAAETPGSDLVPTVDLELLVTTLDDLADRSERGLAAFVHEWDPSLLGVDHAPGDVFVGLPIERYDLNLWYFVEAIIEKRLSPGTGEPFRRARAQIVAELPHHLGLTDSADYLTAVAEWAKAGARQVFTLNYDLAVETAAERSGMSWTHGLDKWKQRRELSWDSDVDVQLVKLHGSLRWDDLVGTGEQSFLLGGVNKLTVQGPYLQLLLELSSALQGAETLIVIGYSFRDSHINGLIQRFIEDVAERGDSPKIHIVDPSYRYEDELPRSVVPRNMATSYYQEQRRVELKVWRENASVALAHGVLSSTP